MEKFIIHGGKKLHGSVRLGGAKNASFKLMIAALLAPGETHLLNIPRIDDVEITRSIIQHLGGSVRAAGERLFCLDPRGLKTPEIPLSFGTRSRASSMFIPPLLARFQKATVPLPGGDRIGERPLNRLFEGLKLMGAQVVQNQGTITVTAKKLHGARISFEKNTHTGTETMILAAVLAQGSSIIDNAAQEPEVDDLIAMLVSMGARIKRTLKRRICIQGVRRLEPTIYSVMPDRNEAVSYAIAAVATGGDIIVENARQEHLGAFLDKLSEAGGGFEVGSFGIRFFAKGQLRAVKVTTQPYPGFMTDWQPLWAVLMTQAQGESIIHESVHNNRFQYVKDLVRMGANIKLFNPRVADPKTFYNFNLADERLQYKHGVKIFGPSPLKGLDIAVHDLRAGATLVLAALIAQGSSRLRGIDQIDRGYENLDGRLIDLGANIKRS